MSDSVITVLVTIGIFVGLPVASLLARDWFARPSKKKIEEYSRQFTERLQHPDFAAVEKDFGHPLPACVQALYANRQELLREDFEVAAVPDAELDHRWKSKHEITERMGCTQRRDRASVYNRTSLARRA